MCEDSTQCNDTSRVVWVELQPLPLTRRVAEMIRSAMAMDRVCNLLPLDLHQSLLIAQGMVEAGIDAIEVPRDELGQQLDLHNR